MKITSVEPIHISVPYSFGGSATISHSAPWRNMDTLLVKVETDDGVTGWGEGFGLGACAITKAVISTTVGPLVVGRDPRDIAGLMNNLQRRLCSYGRNGPVSFALSGIDIALWDIAAKIKGEPLHRLLGGQAAARVPAYASLVRYGAADLVAQFCSQAVDEGYDRIKLHEIGVAEVAAARRAIGRDVALMLDTNCPWTADEAIGMARQLAPYDLLWLEEPVWPPEDYRALARVRREGGIAIAAGENAGPFYDFGELIDTARVDYLQPSVAKVGGISEMRRIIALADASGIPIAPHSPYFGPGLIATLHICASLPAHPAVERL